MTATLNPYRTLARQARALLQVEALFPPEQKQQVQWHLLVHFSETQASVGKGDVNTCFLTLGKDGERQVNYPHVILDELDRLARQPYPVYRVTDFKRWKQFHDLRAALRVKPHRHMIIQGAVEGGWARTHDARPNSVGEVRWIPTKQ